jgi:hypothetical protein
LLEEIVFLSKSLASPLVLLFYQNYRIRIRLKVDSFLIFYLDTATFLV